MWGLTPARSNEETHARYCANSRIWSALFLIALCVVEVCLSRRELGKEFSTYSFDVLIEDFVGITVGIGLFQIFRCLRERFVIGIVIVRAAIGLASAALTNLVNSFSDVVRKAIFALWMFAFFVSLSMLVDAVRSPRVVIGEINAKTTRHVRIFLIVVAAMLLVGMLMYFVPSR
jgi:hypothetical protein